MNQDPGPWQTPERTCRHVPCSNNQPAFVLCTCIALIYEKNKQQKQWKEKYEAEHTVAARSGAPKPWGRIFNFPPGLIFHGLWVLYFFLAHVRGSAISCCYNAYKCSPAIAGDFFRGLKT